MRQARSQYLFLHADDAGLGYNWRFWRSRRHIIQETNYWSSYKDIFYRLQRNNKDEYFLNCAFGHSHACHDIKIKGWRRLLGLSPRIPWTRGRRNCIQTIFRLGPTRFNWLQILQRPHYLISKISRHSRAWGLNWNNLRQNTMQRQLTPNTSIKATGIKRGTIFISANCASTLLF